MPERAKQQSSTVLCFLCMHQQTSFTLFSFDPFSLFFFTLRLSLQKYVCVLLLWCLARFEKRPCPVWYLCCEVYLNIVGGTCKAHSLQRHQVGTEITGKSFHFYFHEKIASFRKGSFIWKIVCDLFLIRIGSHVISVGANEIYIYALI